MLKNELKWRKLDNTAKIFSLEGKENHNIFRYSVILKQTINKNYLKEALDKTLLKFKSFKVKISNGFFWNYLEYNYKEPIIEKETDIPCQSFNLFLNNDYLFKITYFNNKINLDIFHVLTDGVGAIEFFKTLITNYLNITTSENIKIKQLEQKNNKDEYINNYNNKIKSKSRFKTAFQIKDKILKNKNNTTHLTMKLNKIKEVCKYNKATITEYLTAMYIYAIYLSKYNNKSKKDIVIEIPVNLRKYFNVDTISNFFLVVKINANITEIEKPTFFDILEEVKKEFKEKLNFDKINKKLTRDVKLGNNIFIRLVPLAIKKTFIGYITSIAYKGNTSVLSNVGIIDIDEKYKKYIENIFVLVLPNKNNKVKCTICSYNDKLNISINSIIEDTNIEKTFHNLLKKHIKNIKIETNCLE